MKSLTYERSSRERKYTSVKEERERERDVHKKIEEIANPLCQCVLGPKLKGKQIERYCNI